MNGKTDKIIKTEEEWKQQLTPEQYYVARQKGTERAFTGEYNNTKEKGMYTCVCCGTPLLVLIPSSIQELAGQVSGHLSPRRMFLRKQILNMA